MFKKLLRYLLFLLPWFLSSILFRIDTSYYNILDRPWFAPPGIIFGIVWPIFYILIAYSLYKTYEDSTNNYKIYLVINYLANQLFTLFFFSLKNNFLALVDVIIVLISSVYLFPETRILNRNYSKYLVPYIIWNVYALLLIFSIFILN